jgi:hypothetical protein
MKKEKGNGGLKVTDKRGMNNDMSAIDEFRKKREEEIVTQSRKPRVIPTRRCIVCKVMQKEDDYLFNKEFLFFICLKCGAVQMDVKIAKEVFRQSVEQFLSGKDAGVKTGNAG